MSVNTALSSITEKQKKDNISLDIPKWIKTK